MVLQRFEWSDRLELGVNVMDDEHKILIEKINQLVSTLEEQYIKKDKNNLLRAFNDMAEYTIEHFRDEEQFMQSFNYPQYEPHKKIHEKLLEQVGKYGEQIKNDTIDDKVLVTFLRNWLISHIMGIDMQYASAYKENKHSNNHYRVNQNKKLKYG